MFPAVNIWYNYLETWLVKRYELKSYIKKVYMDGNCIKLRLEYIINAYPNKSINF